LPLKSDIPEALISHEFLVDMLNIYPNGLGQGYNNLPKII